MNNILPGYDDSGGASKPINMVEVDLTLPHHSQVLINARTVDEVRDCANGLGNLFECLPQWGRKNQSAPLITARGLTL